MKINKPVKEDHIVQHILSVIGQYMTDIQQADTQSYFPKISSVLVAESFISVKRVQNQGFTNSFFPLNVLHGADKGESDVLPVYDYFQSIFTIYESDNKKTPISLLTTNQLGLAFYKLGFYDEAIDFFKKSLESQRANSVETDAFKPSQLAINAMCRYNLANAFMSAGFIQNALKVWESLISGVNISDLSLLTKEVRKIISEYFFNAAYCLMQQSENQKAINYFYKALIISDNSSNEIKIGIASCYSNLNEHGKSINLFEDILSKSNLDPISKFFALKGYSNKLLQHQHLKGKTFIKKMTENVIKMNSIINEERNLFRKELCENYFPVISSLIHLEAYLINQKLNFAIETNATSEFVTLQNELELLVKNCDEITKQVKPDLACEQIVKLFTTFGSCFSMIASHSNSENMPKMIKKAHEFLNNTMEIVYQSPNGIMKPTLEQFTTTYSNFTLTHVEKYEEKIDCLTSILKVQEQYDVDKSYTIYNLGNQHFGLARNYLSGENNYEECFDKALLNFEKSKENYTKILENGENKLDTKEHIDFFRALAMSYKGLGLLKFDLKSMHSSIKFYKKALEQKNLSFDEQKDIEEQLEICKQKIKEIGNVFETILNNSKEDHMNKTMDINCTDFTVYGLKNFLETIDVKTEIKDKTTLAVSLEGKSMIKRLKGHLNQELNYGQNMVSN